MLPPVIYELLSEAKNNANSATSSVKPSLFNGINLTNFSIYFSGTASVIGVEMKPGKIALHLILYFPSSLARVLVKPSTPALDAA